MELKILCLLVTIGVLNVESKIMKDFGIDLGDTNKLLRGMPQVDDKLLRGMPQVDGKLLRGMPQVDGKLLIGMPQVNKADATTRISSYSELVFPFYKSEPTSPVDTSNITTCIAASEPPPNVKIGIYAFKAAGGTLFLRHTVGDYCVSDCFKAYRFRDLTAETFESCADAVESSGWANTFTFVDGVCVGYAAWMHSRHTQGSRCHGDSLFYVAENKINNFTGYVTPIVITKPSVSRIFLEIIDKDTCLATNKIVVTAPLGSKTFSTALPIGLRYYFEQYNIALCSLNPPVAAKTVNVTFYDYDGKVLWKETFVHVGRKLPGGSMHPFSGDYGDMCVHQSAINSIEKETACKSNIGSTSFRRTSFLTYAAYRKIISTIPNVPSHFISAFLGIDDSSWQWGKTGHVIGAEDFVSGVYPSPTVAVRLFANATENYLLAPILYSETSNFVCVDFSRVSIDPNNI